MTSSILTYRGQRYIQQKTNADTSIHQVELTYRRQTYLQRRKDSEIKPQVFLVYRGVSYYK